MNSLNYSLIIDTIGIPAVVLLSHNDKLMDQIIMEDKSTLIRELHSLIKSLLEKNNQPIIENIVVVAGPGSYTGIKIGVSTALGLALIWQAKIFFLNYLAILAAQLRINLKIINDRILVIKLARHGEYYMADCSIKEGIVQLNESRLILINELELFLKTNNFSLFVGNCPCAELEKIVPKDKFVYEEYYQSQTLINQAFEKIMKNEFINPDAVSPYYLKEVYINQIKK